MTAKDSNQTAPPAADGDADPPVLEAEFSEVADAPDKPAAADDKAGAKPRTNRLPWALAGLLAAFIAGLIAAPYGMEGLRLIGLLPAAPDPVAASDQLATAEQRIAAIEASIQRLAGRVGVAETAVGDLARADERGVEALATLVGRIDDLAAAPPPADGTPAPDLAARLAALEGALAALETAAAQRGAEVDPAAVAAVQTATVEAVEQRRRQAALLEALERRIGVLEALDRGVAPADDLVRAVADLARQVDRGRAFAVDLARVRALLADRPAASRAAVAVPLDTLEPSAEAGLATRETLARAFEPMAAAVLRADARGEGDGWLDRLSGALASIVTVRRTGDVAGEDASAVISRAEVRLRDGDLGGAVDQLAALTGPAAEAAGPWLARARARLAAEDAVDQLLAQVVPTAGPATQDEAGG